ncbi:MAG: Rrf2 family transcriptional regulator [Balneolaceae bacterium]|nr:Rrf2 family transcriptional regulator [Balneolaceae bacterium]
MRAAIYLASREENDYVSIGTISEQLDISAYFLTKILQNLTKSGMLESLKGPKGGVRLKRPRTKSGSSMWWRPWTGLGLVTECVLGLPGCGDSKPCPVHEEWARVRGDLQEMLESNTLDGLAGKGKSLNLRITEDGKFDWAGDAVVITPVSSVTVDEPVVPSQESNLDLRFGNLRSLRLNYGGRSQPDPYDKHIARYNASACSRVWRPAPSW